jgi:hypothetical protein
MSSPKLFQRLTEVCVRVRDGRPAGDAGFAAEAAAGGTGG